MTVSRLSLTVETSDSIHSDREQPLGYVDEEREGSPFAAASELQRESPDS